MMSKGGEGVYVCMLVFCGKKFQDIHLQNKGRDIQDRWRFIEQQCQKDMVCHHQKWGDCEEDFLLELGWVLMITNSHHKRRKLMDAKDKKSR